MTHEDRLLCNLKAQFHDHTNVNWEAVLLLLRHGANPDVAYLLNYGWLTNDMSNCWLAPKGMVFGVKTCGHIDMIEAMGLSYHDAQRMGFIHISGSIADVGVIPTRYQADALAVAESRGQVRHIHKFQLGGAAGLDAPGEARPKPYERGKLFDVRPGRVIVDDPSLPAYMTDKEARSTLQRIVGVFAD